MYFFLSRPTGKTLQAAVLAAALLLIPGASFADPPINVEADRMISQEAKNTVVFIGNVDAKQGEVTIRTDEMTVHYTEKDQNKGKQANKAKSSKVKKLICIGNVEITQKNWLGTGTRMDYFADERKVILSGNAKAWQGKNMVSGKTITYYLDEKRSVVDGQSGQGKSSRVTATIQQ